MRKIVFLLMLICAQGVLFAESEPVRKMTLGDCYQYALQRNEVVRIQAQKIVQAELQQKEALGTVLPQVSFAASEFLQDTSGIDPSLSGVNSTFARKEKPEAKFVLQQRLFNGLREFAAIDASKSLTQRETLLLKNVAKLLFLDISRSFYEILQQEKDLLDTQDILSLTRERIKELETRVRLGKSRSSELLSVEAQLATLQAEEGKIQGDLAVARESLAYSMGAESASFDLVEDTNTVVSIGSLQQYLDKVSQRKEIQAEMELVRAKKDNMKINRAQFLPTADLLGDYYTKRVGFQEPITWDILFNLNVPLYQGGIALSKLREAASDLRETEIELSQLKRSAESEIKIKYLTVETSIEQSKRLEVAYQKSLESYQMQVEEYRLGLVNNLEVLQAMNQLESAKRDWDRILIQTKINFLDLKIATEELP